MRRRWPLYLLIAHLFCQSALSAASPELEARVGRIVERLKNKHPNDAPEIQAMYEWLFCSDERLNKEALRYFAEHGNMEVLILCIDDWYGIGRACVRHLRDVDYKPSIPHLIRTLESLNTPMFTDTGEGVARRRCLIRELVLALGKLAEIKLPPIETLKPVGIPPVRGRLISRKDGHIRMRVIKDQESEESRIASLVVAPAKASWERNKTEWLRSKRPKDYWGPFQEVPVTVPVERPPEPVPLGWYVTVPETPGGYVHVLLQEYEREHPDEADESDKMYRWLFCGYSREERKAIKYFGEKGLTHILALYVSWPAGETCIEAVKQLVNLDCKRAIPFLIREIEDLNAARPERVARQLGPDKALAKKCKQVFIKALEKLTEVDIGPVNVEDRQQIQAAILRAKKIWTENENEWSKLNSPRDDWDWERLHRLWLQERDGHTENTKKKGTNP